MASPTSSSGGPRPKAAKDRRALLPYLRVQKATDRKMIAILRDARDSANTEMRRLERKVGIGAAVRADQLQVAKAAMFRAMAAAWRSMGDTIRAGRYDAAAAAADSVQIYDKMLFRSVGEGQLHEELMAGLKAMARNNVDLAKTRVEKTAMRLSDRVYKSEALSRGWVDGMLNGMIARGSSAKEIARAATSFIDPATPGGMSYAAMRLGRTELNHAFHAQQNAIMGEQPWVEATQWNLSGSHPEPDECDDYASDSSFNGKPGQYASGEAPASPHPQCLCFLTPVMVDRSEFVGKLRGGDYDSVIGRYT